MTSEAAAHRSPEDWYPDCYQAQSSGRLRDRPSGFVGGGRARRAPGWACATRPPAGLVEEAGWQRPGSAAGPRGGQKAAAPVALVTGAGVEAGW